MNCSVGRRVAVALVVVVAAAGVAVAGSAVLGGGASGRAPSAPHFVEEAAAAGIDHTFGGEDRWYVGGGVAHVRLRRGWPARPVHSGRRRPRAAPRNVSQVGASLRFAPVHDPPTEFSDVTGAYPLDVDGDAVTDLAVLRRGENVFLRGLGDCRFERANERVVV